MLSSGEGTTVMKTANRELRNLLEATQAEVKRLKNELAAREKVEQAEAEQKQARALRARVRELEVEFAATRAEYAKELKQQQASFEAELSAARRETTLAREEAAELKNQVESLTKALAKAESRWTPGVASKPAGGTWWERLRGFFGREIADDLDAKEALARAQREIARLNQQLSLVQLRRRR